MNLQYQSSRLDEAIAFEANAYHGATPETLRLLLHSRGAIRRFLESDLGLCRPR